LLNQQVVVELQTILALQVEMEVQVVVDPLHLPQQVLVEIPALLDLLEDHFLTLKDTLAVLVVVLAMLVEVVALVVLVMDLVIVELKAQVVKVFKLLLLVQHQQPLVLAH